MVIDGAMGTMIQTHKLKEEDFKGNGTNLHIERSYTANTNVHVHVHVHVY